MRMLFLLVLLVPATWLFCDAMFKQLGYCTKDFRVISNAEYIEIGVAKHLKEIEKIRNVGPEAVAEFLENNEFCCSVRKITPNQSFSGLFLFFYPTTEITIAAPEKGSTSHRRNHYYYSDTCGYIADYFISNITRS